LKNPAAADQRLLTVKKDFRWLLQPGSQVLLPRRQEHVLLGLVEAVDFIDEQQRALPLGREPVVGGRKDFAQSLLRPM